MVERVKVVEINGVEYLVVEESTPEEVEFRLYHDDMGNLLFYTCEKPEGQYIVIDRQTYVEARPDWRVVDGKLVKIVPGTIISKLKPNDDEGTECAVDDITIVVDKNFINKQKWKLDSYELQ